MCIVLTTTAHPTYAIIIIDNRDEFILRPTSRPHWWSSGPQHASHPFHQEILSSRDLQRAEQGTWLGVTKNGNFAVLTNYRETDTHDAEHPVEGIRSRGGMVTAWLTAPKSESTDAFVHRLLENDGVKGVGGFSLLCGKLRRRTDSEGKDNVDSVAIVSNRCGTADDVPWICGRRGESQGLSNTAFTDPEVWRKVELGKSKVLSVVEDAVAKQKSEGELIDGLFGVLDTNTLPPVNGRGFEEYISELKNSIFIPMIGTAEPQVQLARAESIANADAEMKEDVKEAMERLDEAEAPEPVLPHVMSGAYGTQRQTVILVDWEGKVTYIERALYDELGKPIKRSEGDVRFEFKVDGWEGDDESKEYDRLPASHL